MANPSGRALLPTAIERTARSAVRHDRAEPETVIGFLRLRYRSAAPLHIGTGSLALWSAEAVQQLGGAAARRAGDSAGPLPVREAARIAGRPGLPGSTLRGALRQRHSRMTRSCVGAGSGQRTRPGERPSQPALEPCRGRELCPTCALFGTPGTRSRVRVSDGITAPETQFALAGLPGPAARGRGGDRRGGPSGGRGAGPRGPAPAPAAPALQWAEVIGPDTLIELELAVRNLRAEELGGLLGALGCEPVTPLICGAGRRAGFGRLFAEGLEIELYRPDGALEEADVASWRKAFEQSSDRWPAGEAALLQELGAEL